MTIITDAPVRIEPDTEHLVTLHPTPDGCEILVAAGATVRPLDDNSVYVFRDKDNEDEDQADDGTSLTGLLDRIRTTDGINICAHEVWTDPEGQHAVSVAESLRKWAGAPRHEPRLRTGGIINNWRYSV